MNKFIMATCDNRWVWLMYSVMTGFIALCPPHFDTDAVLILLSTFGFYAFIYLTFEGKPDAI